MTFERSNVSKLDDESPMPFGTHRGKRLGEVPDSWWRWFLSEDWCDEWPELAAYANHVMDERAAKAAGGDDE